MAFQVGPSLFTYHHDNILVFLFICVDNILNKGNDTSHIRCLIQKIELLIHIEGLWSITLFLWH